MVFYVDITSFLEKEGEEDLRKYPNEGKIDSEWVAYSTDWAYFRIGPNSSGYDKGCYIEDIKICVKHKWDLEKLAKKSGLNVIETNQWDQDGVLKNDYRFERIEDKLNGDGEQPKVKENERI